MSIFTDRRPLRQIGGVRGYLRQVTWSLKWRLEWRLGKRRHGSVSRRQPPLYPEETAPTFSFAPPGQRGTTTLTKVGGRPISKRQ